MPPFGKKYLVLGNNQEHLAFSSACSWGKNVSADELSRHLNLQLEWSEVSPSVFHAISACFGAPVIDLSASRLTTLLPEYVSWQPDPIAKYIDAFKID